jgi:DNA-binding GntR family transcriptional regulator
MTVNQNNQKMDDLTADEVDAGPETSRVDEVYHQILLRIVRGEIHGGEKLKSTELAQSLGLSRTPVVQALQRLAADGIVTLEVNKRAVVRPGAENWLVEIHQMRELLEPHAADLATERLTDEELATLRGLAEEARPGGRKDWTDAAQRFDYALHLAIAGACGNLALCEAIKKCWSFKRISYEAGEDSPEAVARGYNEHLAILDALAKRDRRTASVAMLFHLRASAAYRTAARIV